MKLLVDTNILISALIKDGATRKLLFHLDAELLTIALLEQEIENYQAIILEKAEIDILIFNRIFETLKARITFLEDDLFIPFMPFASEIMDPIDPGDTPFLAAALATGAEIWSDDVHFQQQTRVKVWTTSHLLHFLEHKTYK